MADGWLFRLRSTLGARHAVPAWPASGRTDDAPAALEAEWPPLCDAGATPRQSDGKDGEGGER